jgi:peptidoglycan LD-endopeptidase CwlK
VIGCRARTPTWFGWVGRVIKITTQDFRIQAGLRTRERQAELVARGASRTMYSRHLTGHAVDLVALGGGEISC